MSGSQTLNSHDAAPSVSAQIGIVHLKNPLLTNNSMSISLPLKPYQERVANHYLETALLYSKKEIRSMNQAMKVRIIQNDGRENILINA